MRSFQTHINAGSRPFTCVDVTTQASSYLHIFIYTICINTSDERLQHINLTVWTRRQYFEKHTCNSRLLTQSLFLVEILFTESSTYVSKRDLRDTIWMLLKISALSLNIRLHEYQINHVFQTKLSLLCGNVWTIFLQLTKSCNERN